MFLNLSAIFNHSCSFPEWYFEAIDFMIMILDCIVGRRGIGIQFPPSNLAKNIIVTSIICGNDDWRAKVDIDIHHT
jgi:hypothetical protein